MIHIPILRWGEPYYSLKRATLADIRTGEPVAQMSLANGGLIGRDLGRAGESQRRLATVGCEELVEICGRAAEFFVDGELPLGEGGQSPQEYIALLSATTGMPQSLCRRNSEKIRLVLSEMRGVLDGLTRGMKLSVLDAGWGEQEGRMLSYLRQADALGAVLPNNSPGVHSLWLPAIPLKVPLALKPGSEEPWTPYRIAQAFIAAGCPPEAFGFYPCDYGAATQILLRCERSMVFGGEATVGPWRGDSRVEIHGPGRSKILFGEDAVDEWEDHLDVVVASVAENGGRSCINASGVWVPSRGREIAEGLARRLAQIEPRALDDADAELAAFSNPVVAHRLSELIDRQLKTPGAEDLTAKVRGADRVAEVGGCTFLRPTVIWCEDPEHPLANAEYLFPFVAVVEMPQRELLQAIGPTLVATAITADESFIGELLACTSVDRLNLGPMQTNRVSWDQPHEGNLFEFLYRQRAFAAMPKRA
jgi:hypothetical protein